MYNLTGYVMTLCSWEEVLYAYIVNQNLNIMLLKNISEFKEAVACEFIGQTEIFLLVICYRSPNSTLCNDQKLFDLLLDLAQRNYNNIFIVGDFNYCTIDWNLRVIRS